MLLSTKVGGKEEGWGNTLKVAVINASINYALFYLIRFSFARDRALVDRWKMCQ